MIDLRSVIARFHDDAIEYTQLDRERGIVDTRQQHLVSVLSDHGYSIIETENMLNSHPCSEFEALEMDHDAAVKRAEMAEAALARVLAIANDEQYQDDYGLLIIDPERLVEAAALVADAKVTREHGSRDVSSDETVARIWKEAREQNRTDEPNRLRRSARARSRGEAER